MLQELIPQVAAPPDGFDVTHMVTLDAARWAPIFKMFAKKLTLAMHYKAVGRPLGSSGGLVPLLVPNGHYDKVWDNQILAVTRAGPAARHGSENLSNQITFRWAHDPSAGVFCGRLTLQKSLVVYGFTADNVHSERLAEVAGRLDQPFNW